MDAGEPHRVLSVCARPSSWPLVGRPWLRASKGVHDEILSNLHEGIAARATEPISKLSACQWLVRAGAPLTLNWVASTTPIQYP